MSLRKISFYLVLFCFIWFPLQDLIISFLYRLWPTKNLFFLLIMKEMIMLLVLMGLILGKFSLKKFEISLIEILSFSYFLISLMYLLTTLARGATHIAIFASFRTLLLPIMFVLVGKWLYLTRQEIKSLVNVIIGISVFSILFGFIEMFFPVDKFWNGMLNLYGYLRNLKGLSLHGFVNDVPGNFWGYTRFRRMASFFASPLALGYYLIFPILLVFVFKINGFRGKKLGFFFLLLVVGLLLTETRAAVVAVIIGIVLVVAKEYKKFFFTFWIKKRLIRYLLIAILIFSLPFIFSERARDFFIKTVTVKEGRVLGHSIALEKSIGNMGEVIFLGKGIGSAGAWSGIGGSVVKSLAGENAYLPIMAQIGGIGLIIFLLWWVAVYRSVCFRAVKVGRNDVYLESIVRAVIVANVVYFLTGIVSEQILTFTSVAHFWILTGAVLGMREN